MLLIITLPCHTRISFAFILGTCYDEVNNFRCDCPAGFLGKTCTNATDECSATPCKNGGTCRDLHLDYSVSWTCRGVAWEQALRGALAAGREKKGEIATMSLKFEYLHRKSRYEMLIGGNDTSNDLPRVFQVLLTFALVTALRWLAEIWQLSRRGAAAELEAEFKFQRHSCKLSVLFPPRRRSDPESLLAG